MTVYTFVDAGGQEHGSFSTQDYQEAKAYAQEHKLRVIANEYEWRDSEPLNDYTDATDDDNETGDESCR